VSAERTALDRTRTGASPGDRLIDQLANGYLPTHNPNYRLPQGKDPVWNSANCRNRRLFNDRAVKKVAANTRPFLLQTYRRDMGGGNFVLMKDLSSPIFVRGRHWGAFRMGIQPT
jgi:methyl-accepting chemotaxis protein